MKKLSPLINTFSGEFFIRNGVLKRGEKVWLGYSNGERTDGIHCRYVFISFLSFC